jgi:hypothetical protein
VKARVVLIAVAVFGVLPLTTAATCDPPKKGPAPAVFVVQTKRQPCGANHVCEGNEVNCWQIQYKRVATGEVGFKCVSKKDWDGYKIGDAFRG